MEKTITNRDDLRVGDVATFAFEGHEFTGRLWAREEGSLYLGDAPARYASGNWFDSYEFVRATRPAPTLPTDLGSVIFVTECRGERADKPVMAVKASGEWVTFGYRFAGYDWHHPEYIGAWEPAKVVPV